MPLLGPLAWAVWIAAYGVPVGLTYLYLRYVEHRGGSWQVLHVMVFLLLGAGCGLIAYSLRHTFVVAPFIGYALAGAIGLASLPIVRGFWLDVFNLSDRRTLSKPSVHCELTVSTEEARTGTTKTLTRNGKNLQVSVPAGVTSGITVRLTNAMKITDGYAGDILVQIVIGEGSRTTPWPSSQLQFNASASPASPVWNVDPTRYNQFPLPLPAPSTKSNPYPLTLLKSELYSFLWSLHSSFVGHYNQSYQISQIYGICVSYALVLQVNIRGWLAFPPAPHAAPTSSAL